MGSPVSALSSTSRASEASSTPSQGILSPASRQTMSPSTMSVTLIWRALPSRMTSTSTSSLAADSLRNCRSFSLSLKAVTMETTSTAARMARPSTYPVAGSS
eukprot:scaffold34398_cov51-Attheya_sp.AAC.3